MFTPAHLNEGQINWFFQTLLKQAAKTPMACAAALQLGGGFSIAQIQQLRWRDVLSEPDMVRIRTRDDVCGGSTHDRTRPIMPGAAEVLRCRYEALCKETTARQLENRFLLERARMARSLHPASWFDTTIVSLQSLAFGQRQLQRRARKPTPVVCCWRLTRIR